MIYRLALLVVLLTAASGCAHHQLRYQTTSQANTLNDIYEQQVLDNLAMFVSNPYAVPFFSFPNEGGSNVQTHRQLSGDAPLDPFFSAIGFEAGRDATESWVVTPVRDPDKIRLMRAAYQRSLGVQDPCNDFCNLLKEFRGQPKLDCCDPCLLTTGWLCNSDRKRDVPKCCCRKYGKYCGTYVWVKPGCEAEFAKLVLLIIEFAVKEPVVIKKTNKKVTFYIDEHGNPVKQSDALGQLEVILPIRTPVEAAINPEEVQMRIEKLDEEIRNVQSSIRSQLQEANISSSHVQSDGLKTFAAEAIQKNAVSSDVQDSVNSGVLNLQSLESQRAQLRGSADFEVEVLEPIGSDQNSNYLKFQQLQNNLAPISPR